MTHAEEQKLLESVFRKAEKELNEVAKKYDFSLRLVDDRWGTWYFFPQVEDDFKLEDKP